jgi:hypothetical protein
MIVKYAPTSASANWCDGFTSCRALRRLREASGLSDDQLVAELGDPTDDLKHLDNGFSDRVQVGDIKSFVDACGGFLDIVVYDRDGRVLSERQLAPIGRSTEDVTRPGDSTQLDEEALTQRVTARVLRQVALASESALAPVAKEEMPPFALHESPDRFVHVEQEPDESDPT